MNLISLTHIQPLASISHHGLQPSAFPPPWVGVLFGVYFLPHVPMFQATTFTYSGAFGLTDAHRARVNGGPLTFVWFGFACPIEPLDVFNGNANHTRTPRGAIKVRSFILVRW